MKRILFLSYWELGEPLNASCVLPFLRLLSERPDVSGIHLITLETAKDPLPVPSVEIGKVSVRQLKPPFRRPHLLGKAILFISSILILSRFIKKNGINLIIAKTSLAGALAEILRRTTGTPYNVELFEPHSQYMLECKEWARSSMRYRFMRHMERLQMKHARFLLPPTANQRDDMVAAGVPSSKVRVIPSIVPVEEFEFSPAGRMRIRDHLGIPHNASVGIYVGKFGGMYYDAEAFHIFKKAYDHFKDLHLIVLSPMPAESIMAKAVQANLDLDRFHLGCVPHAEVPAYLSAADFAFSMIRPAPSKRYQSPVKNGEYWANGLPFLMPDEVADDYKVLRQGLGGAIIDWDLSNLDESFEQLKAILQRPDHRETIRDLALRHRSLEIAKRVYEEVI